MTAVSSMYTSSHSSVDARGYSAQSRSTSSPSLLHLVKTTGVLALALSGGAQAAGLRSFPNNRHLLQVSEEAPTAAPYNYDSICSKPGVLDYYVDGLNYEDCITQENASIDLVAKRKPSEKLKKCYQASGYLSAASFGAGLLSAITCTDAGMAAGHAGLVVGLLALPSTAVCGFMHQNIVDRLAQSREVAEKCCRFFPKKADVNATQPTLTPPQGSPSPDLDQR